jgi:Uma2 family endonuclease
MATATMSEPATLAEVLHRLGDVPTERILARPAPGIATEDDLVRLLDAADKRLCELVDGVLVEKTMGIKESALGNRLAARIDSFAEEHDLGIVFGADGPYRLFAGRIRMPDVSFVSWDQLPDDGLPDEPIADLAPRLAAEILSKSNTRGEIERKLQDYFKAGVQLVWIIDRVKQIVDVHTSPKKYRRLTIDDKLDGGRVLPGFRLALKELFAPHKRKK